MTDLSYGYGPGKGLEYYYDLTYHEACRAEFANGQFSAGRVDGHPQDNIYLRLKRDCESDTVIGLKANEALAIIWLLSAVLHRLEGE